MKGNEEFDEKSPTYNNKSSQNESIMIESMKLTEPELISS